MEDEHEDAALHSKEYVDFDPAGAPQHAAQPYSLPFIPTPIPLKSTSHGVQPAPVPLQSDEFPVIDQVPSGHFLSNVEGVFLAAPSHASQPAAAFAAIIDLPIVSTRQSVQKGVLLSVPLADHDPSKQLAANI